MNGKEFIKMMRQDIETHPEKEQLSGVVEVMEFVIARTPGADINPAGKTPDDCFEKMKDHAKKHAKSGCFFSGHEESIKFIAKYLGLKAVGDKQKIESVREKINLEDFF